MGNVISIQLMVLFRQKQAHHMRFLKFNHSGDQYKATQFFWFLIIFNSFKYVDLKEFLYIPWTEGG